MREDNFMGEERRPFEGRGPVGFGPADQFMFAPGRLHQFRLAKMADDLTAITLRKEMFQFHTPPR